MTDNAHSKIIAILLAAGLSTRMGRPKQLLPFGNSTIIETVIDNMLSSNFDEVRVVLGHCAKEIEELLIDRSVLTVYNPDYKDGMLSSAQIGIKSIEYPYSSTKADQNSNETNRDAFSIMLVDQPFITTELINKTIDGYRGSKKGITMPSYNYQRGHPVIFHNKFAKDILALNEDSGGIRSLYSSYSEEIEYINVDTDYIIKDIDFPDDYTNALQESVNRNC